MTKTQKKSKPAAPMLVQHRIANTCLLSSPSRIKVTNCPAVQSSKTVYLSAQQEGLLVVLKSLLLSLFLFCPFFVFRTLNALVGRSSRASAKVTTE